MTIFQTVVFFYLWFGVMWVGYIIFVAIEHETKETIIHSIKSKEVWLLVIILWVTWPLFVIASIKAYIRDRC